MYSKYKNISQTVLDRSFELYFEKCVEWYKKKFKKESGDIEDISNSAWHIKRAKNNFNELVEKYKTNYENLSKDICHVCGAETDIECGDCGYPVCDSCLGKNRLPPNPQKEYDFCIMCQ